MKKFLLSLGVGFLGIISFGYCDTINVTSFSIGSLQTQSSSCNGFCCFSSTSTFMRLSSVKISYGNISDIDLFNGVSNNYPLTCLEIDGTFSIYNGASSSSTFLFWDITDLVPSSSCPECPSCPSCSSSTLFLDQEPEDGFGFHDSFDLSGISNVYFNFPDDITYNYSESSGYLQFNLVNNRLINTGIDLSGLEWSALFINDIQHVSAPLINITIPEEFEWTYTGNDEQFELNISGYNVDTEYIAGIINKQTTLPNNRDFNNIITGLIPLFVPGLCVILLLVFIFRFIKKIF